MILAFYVSLSFYQNVNSCKFLGQESSYFWRSVLSLVHWCNHKASSSTTVLPWKIEDICYVNIYSIAGPQIEIALTGCIAAWFRKSNAQEWRLQSAVDTAWIITGTNIPNVKRIFWRRCLKKGSHYHQRPAPPWPCSYFMPTIRKVVQESGTGTWKPWPPGQD